MLVWKTEGDEEKNVFNGVRDEISNLHLRPMERETHTDDERL